MTSSVPIFSPLSCCRRSARSSAAGSSLPRSIRSSPSRLREPCGTRIGLWPGCDGFQGAKFITPTRGGLKKPLFLGACSDMPGLCAGCSPAARRAQTHAAPDRPPGERDGFTRSSYGGAAWVFLSATTVRAVAAARKRSTERRERRFRCDERRTERASSCAADTKPASYADGAEVDTRRPASRGRSG